MKYVYVLVSRSNDCYAEQTIVSIYSLRKTNPGCHVLVAADDDTLKSLTGKRSRLKDIVDEFVCVDVPVNYSPVQRSRHIKTSLRQRISGDFLFVDADTLILGDLSGLAEIGDDFCVARMQDSYEWSEDNPQGMLKTYYEMRGLKEYSGVRDYYNSGVMFIKDTPVAHELFRDWHELWTESSTQFGYHKDQPALWIANYRKGSIIKDLDGKYNLQATAPRIALRYLGDCRVFHYISTARFLTGFNMKNPESLDKMLDSDNSAELDKMLADVKNDYLNGLYISTNPLDWIYSPLVQIARKISKRLPVIDKTIIKINNLFHKKY